MQELDERGADASCKTAFVLALLRCLSAEGHRTLVFSQSKVMLNILEVRTQQASARQSWLNLFYGQHTTPRVAPVAAC